MVIRARVAAAAVAMVGLAWLVAVRPVGAACALTAESVAAADVVFVGVLRGVDRAGMATFEVEEVWRGQEFVTSEMVQVDAANVGIEAPPDANVQSPTYLVLASERDGVLRTGDSPANLCARYPFPWDPSYATFRPPGASPQPAGGVEGSGVPWLPIAVGTAALAIGLAAFLITPGGRRLRSG